LAAITQTDTIVGLALSSINTKRIDDDVACIHDLLSKRQNLQAPETDPGGLVGWWVHVTACTKSKR
jgi:hypothetical protein